MSFSVSVDFISDILRVRLSVIARCISSVLGATQFDFACK